MGKIYIAPIAEFEEIELDGDLMAANSQPTTQCDCEQFRMYGGCRGCPGHCACGGCD